MRTKIISFILCFVIVLQNLTFIMADVSPSVDSYKLYDAGGSTQLSLMNAGDKGKLELTVIDSGVSEKKSVSKENIEVTGISGCFGTSPEVSKKEILSGTGDLSYKLTFDDVVYTGTGNYFSFKIRYKDLQQTSKQINVKISECNFSGTSGDTYTETDENGESKTTNLPPSVEITRSDLSPIKSGQVFNTEITIKNHGSTTMLKPVVSIATAGDISLEGNSSAIFIPDIKPGARAKLALKFRAEDKISNSSEEFTVTVKYNYDSGSGNITSNSESTVITVPMIADTEEDGNPIISVSLKNNGTVKADTAYTIPVTVKNLGNADAKSAVVNITSDEGFVITSDLTQVIDNLPKNSSKVFNINIKTDRILNEHFLTLNCDVKYNYTSNKITQSGSETAKLLIPCVSNVQKNASPLIQITKSDIPTVKANQKFSFTVTLKNVGTTDIVNSVLNFESGDGIVLTDGTSSFAFSGLKASESKKFTVKCRAESELSTSSSSINAELKYNYLASKSYESGNESTKIIVPMVKTNKDDEEKSKSATPNIIIDNYNYGGQSIANGEKFGLDIMFKNMGNVTVENIVMTVEPDASLAISSAANTYYLKSMGSGAVESRSIEMMALPTAESGSAKLNVSFKYEYVDNKQRNEVTSTQSISVPIYKPDFMEMTPQSTDTPGVVGNEYPISIAYVNKGKGEISNVRAELIGDIEAIQKVQNLGNFEAGKSGNINFVVTPQQEGSNDFSIKVTYEDANMKEKERIFNFSVNAEAPSLDDMEEFPEDMGMEEEGKKNGRILPVGIGVGAAIIALIVILKKIKKKKDSIKINWED